jgi:hypothetical protein
MNLRLRVAKLYDSIEERGQHPQPYRTHHGEGAFFIIHLVLLGLVGLLLVGFQLCAETTQPLPASPPSSSAR